MTHKIYYLITAYNGGNHSERFFNSEDKLKDALRFIVEDDINRLGNEDENISGLLADGAVYEAFEEWYNSTDPDDRYFYGHSTVELSTN